MKKTPEWIQWTRSLVFVVQMYLVMAGLALLFALPAAMHRRYAFVAIRLYCRWIRWSADLLVGLRSEIRGQVPTGPALICSKHQSFFDILIICSVIDRPRFVMKKQLKNVPIIGYYARIIGCIVVDRGRKSLAVKQMMRQIDRNGDSKGQLVIFPQGTRVKPGASAPYKIGAALLYNRLECQCIPAATNVGVFWPRRAIMRRQGLAVVEFLDPITSGLLQRDFMVTLESTVESHSNRLMKEAGLGRGQVERTLPG